MVLTEYSIRQIGHQKSYRSSDDMYLEELVRKWVGMGTEETGLRMHLEIYYPIRMGRVLEDPVEPDTPGKSRISGNNCESYGMFTEQRYFNQLFKKEIQSCTDRHM